MVAHPALKGRHNAAIPTRWLALRSQGQGLPNSARLHANKHLAPTILYPKNGYT